MASTGRTHHTTRTFGRPKPIHHIMPVIFASAIRARMLMEA